MNQSQKYLISNSLSKGGKPAFIGEIREYNGRKFKKTINGWEELHTKHKVEQQQSTLNHNDLEIIENYCGDMFHKLNSDLRKKNDNNFENEILLNDALDKLPDFKGKVFRSEVMWKSFEDHIKDFESNVFQFRPEFLSTSKAKINQLFKFEDGHEKIYYEIDSKTGKDVEKYSDLQEEKEVLFKSKTMFEIVSIKINKFKNGSLKGKPLNLVIKLKEI